MSKLFLKSIALLFVAAFMLTSCEKENLDVIEETNEELDLKLEITIRGNTTTFDAYAAYCNENSIESFSVSNNPDLLNNEFWNESLQENDFIIHYRNDEASESNFTLSGATFSVEDMGQSILLTSLDFDNDVVIEEANSSIISGSLDGTFIIDPDTGEEVTYSATFTAEVDPDIVPVFCN